MAFVDLPLSDLDLIYLIESSVFRSMEEILTYFQLLAVYHKVCSVPITPPYLHP